MTGTDDGACLVGISGKTGGGTGSGGGSGTAGRVRMGMMRRVLSHEPPVEHVRVAVVIDGVQVSPPSPLYVSKTVVQEQGWPLGQFRENVFSAG